MSDFCFETSGSLENVYVEALERIEISLSPHISLFEENEGRRNYKTVVIINGLCYQTSKIESQDVTLTTHLTLEKMNRLSAVAARWNGPVSAAIKISGVDELYSFRSQVYAHIQHLKEVSFHFYFESKARAYPNNILRNIALNEVKSSYFVMLDVDFLPSPLNTHQSLRSMMLKHTSIQKKLRNKTVFVLPAFEIKEEIAEENIAVQHPWYPESREGLVHELQSNSTEQKVFAFHQDAYKPGHRSTNYSKWTSDIEVVSYPIKALEFGYEPYIVGAKGNIPKFFEDYRGYGLNKMSYFVELHYAQYQMEVLRDFFIFHLDHTSTYFNRTELKKTPKINKSCTKIFLRKLLKAYGAGKLSSEKEIAGLDVWQSHK